VLNSGAPTDNAKEIFDRYRDFDIRIVRHPWGVKLEVQNAPAAAFVDGEMIRGIKEHLFAVLRDVVFISNEILASGRFDLTDRASITNAVFHVLRNARLLDYKARPNLVVCWGGHSIDAQEYQYTKNVGYELGLRGLDVCTGCGPGAMKGPMKGATIGHAKQRIEHGRYIGITEPGIIAAEPPNPIVSQLAIMPDIEKRLEAFVRFGHGIVVFPGGAGTAEEILYLTGILLDPANREQPFPIVLTGPRDSAAYSSRLPASSPAPWGARRCGGWSPSSMTRRRWRGAWCAAWTRYASSAATAATRTTSTGCCRFSRSSSSPSRSTHATMRALQLKREQPPHELAANLRRAFSGIVTGNVKEYGIQAIEREGPYELSGDPSIMLLLDELLAAFIAQRRMRLPGSTYRPVYRLVA